MGILGSITRFFFILAISLLLVLPAIPKLCADSAITVPPGAREQIEAALASLEQERTEKEAEGYREEADHYVETTEEEAKQAERELEEARLALEEAEREAKALQEQVMPASRDYLLALERAEMLTKKSQEAMAKAQALSKQADGLTAAAQKKDAQVRAYLRGLAPPLSDSLPLPSVPAPMPEPVDEVDRRALEYTDELRRMEEEIREQERYREEMEDARRTGVPVVAPPPPPPGSEGDLNMPRGGDWSSVNYLYRRAAAMEKAAVAINEQGEKAWEVVSEKMAIADEIYYKAEDASLVWHDLSTAIPDYEAYARESRSLAEETLLERNRLYALQNNPTGTWFSWGGMKYHRWDSDHRNGYQLMYPISFGYWHPQYSIGVYTSYVQANDVDTFTDTSVYLSYKDEREKYTLDYTLTLNVPTGKSALNWNERFSRITEDLVSVEQFGKGWQFTPGIAVTWKTSREETWTVGTSYTFSQSYDPTSDIPNDDISPGGEWGKWLRYQNANDDRQFVAELLNTSYGRTKLDSGDSYSQNDSWKLRTAYNKVLSPTENLMFYYWLEQDNPSNVPLGNNLVHYFGTMYKRKLNEKSDLRLMADVMTTNESRYLGMYSYYDYYGRPAYGAESVDGRTKYTFGVGYDHRISPQSYLNLDIEYFMMQDGASTRGIPATDYTGWNAYMTLYLNF